MKQLLLDSNVALRFLLSDDAKQSPMATRVFALAGQGDFMLRLEGLVVAECAYVLLGFGRKRESIASALSQLIVADGIQCDDKHLLLDALQRFSATRIDFQDAWLAALSSATQMDVVSFDRDFDKFSDVVRLEPGRDLI
jgi:predicted nucleic-acid-binding protein